MPAQIVEGAEPFRRLQNLERQHAREEARDAGDEAARFRVDRLREVVFECSLALVGVGQREAGLVLREIAVGLARLRAAASSSR